MKIYSWNVNGIRAVWNKGLFQKFIDEHQPDILCLQETKAHQDQSEVDVPGYEEFWHSADKKGYSGTAIFTKHKPLSVTFGFSNAIKKQFGEMADKYGDPQAEGRVTTAEFEKFYVVTVYTPNSKGDLTRLELRDKLWDPAFLAHCKELETRGLQPDAALQFSLSNGASRTDKYGEVSSAGETAKMHRKARQVGISDTEQVGLVQGSGKPVVFCGDLNVAHTEDDLANPKPNVGKHGFTVEERKGFQNFIDAGFIDTFRLFTTGNGHYSWWTHWANARARNVGWRIDYFLVSESFKSKIKESKIHADVMGSDHCPVSVTIEA